MAGEIQIEVKSNIPKPEDAKPTVFTGGKTEMVTVTYDNLTGEIMVEPGWGGSGSAGGSCNGNSLVQSVNQTELFPQRETNQ